MKFDKKKHTVTIKKEDLRWKPRSGVIYQKVVPDKTKYTRKNKHKDKKDSNDE